MTYLDSLYIAWGRAEATGCTGLANFYVWLIHQELNK